MRKINIGAIGSFVTDMIRSNSRTIVGGLSMIVLGVLCKKLDIPYDILIDPFEPSYTPRKSNSRNSVNIPFVMPNNSVEASISAICDSACATHDAYYKNQAVNKIIDILKSKNEIDETTKTYAIWCIKSIISTTNDAYYINCMNNRIVDIGKGRL